MVNVSWKRSSRAAAANGRLTTDSKVSAPRPLHSPRTYVTSTATYIFGTKRLRNFRRSKAAMRTCRRRDDSPRTWAPSMHFRSEELLTLDTQAVAERRAAGDLPWSGGRGWGGDALPFVFRDVWELGAPIRSQRRSAWRRRWVRGATAGWRRRQRRSRGGACALPFQGLRSSAPMRAAPALPRPPSSALRPPPRAPHTANNVTKSTQPDHFKCSTPRAQLNWA